MSISTSRLASMALMGVMVLALGACAGAADKVINPSRPEFAFGASVRQAVAAQTVPPTTDPLEPVEGQHGVKVEKAMREYKYGAEKDASSGTPGTMLFAPSGKDGKKP